MLFLIKDSFSKLQGFQYMPVLLRFWHIQKKYNAFLRLALGKKHDSNSVKKL